MSENQRSGLPPLRNQSLVLLSMRPHRAWVGTAWVMLGTRDLGGADVGGSVQEFPLRPCVRAGINFPQRLNKIIINKVKSPTTNIKYDGTSNRKMLVRTHYLSQVICEGAPRARGATRRVDGVCCPLSGYHVGSCV
jgi:hypothetical protein